VFVYQLSNSLTGEVGEEIATLVGRVDRGEDALLFTMKTYSCWELMFAADSNSSESSIDSSSNVNDSDSDLTATPQLAQPLTK
jgi:hypothetical protein